MDVKLGADSVKLHRCVCVPLYLRMITMETQLSNASIFDKGLTSTGHQLAWIKNMLSASVAELADAFHVSHQSIYAWLNEEPPSEDNVVKFRDLVSAANIIERSGFGKERSQLRRRFADGKTLLQIVGAGESATEVAERLIATLQREQAEGVRIASRLAGRARPAQSPDFDFPAAG